MNNMANIAAAIGYVPLIGWVLSPLLGKGNAFVRFHLRQSIGLVGFLLAMGLAWAAISFVVMALIPYGFVVANLLFALVISALLFAVVALVGGLSNALRGRAAVLPIFGSMANRLPF
jgi:uncharacterized membrane protein